MCREQDTLNFFKTSEEKKQLNISDPTLLFMCGQFLTCVMAAVGTELSDDNPVLLSALLLMMHQLHRIPSSLTHISWFDQVYHQLSPKQFRFFFHISTDAFDELMSELRYQHDHTVAGRPCTAKEKAICLALWRLCTNEPLKDISVRFGVSIATVCRTSEDIYELIYKNLRQKWLVNIDRTRGATPEVISKGFRQLHNLPNVFGAIDGTHIRIAMPGADFKYYVNRKSYASIIMQAMVDAKGVFRHIFIGYPGSVHDARVYRNSPLYLAADHLIAYPTWHVSI